MWGDLLAQRVDRFDHALRARGGEAAVLLEPTALALERMHGVEVAELAEQLVLLLRRALDRLREGLQDEPVDVRAGGEQQVVLAGEQQLERVGVVVEAAPQPAGEAGEHM